MLKYNQFRLWFAQRRFILGQRSRKKPVQLFAVISTLCFELSNLDLNVTAHVTVSRPKAAEMQLTCRVFTSIFLNKKAVHPWSFYLPYSTVSLRSSWSIRNKLALSNVHENFYQYIRRSVSVKQNRARLLGADGMSEAGRVLQGKRRKVDRVPYKPRLSEWITDLNACSYCL